MLDPFRLSCLCKAGSLGTYICTSARGFSHRVEGHLFGSKNYGYTKYEKREDFENAVADLYENDVAPLVEKGISALIYTQISDIEDETNGFVTYDRRVLKVSTERMKRISERLIEASNSKEEIQ